MSESKENQESLTEVIQACRKLHAALDRFDHMVCVKLKLSRNDLRCLNSLEHGALSPGELSERLELTSGSVTTLVGRLTSRGLVKKERNLDDGRAYKIKLLPKAFQTLGQDYRQLAETIQKHFSEFSGPERQAGIKLVQSISQACETCSENIS